MPVTTPVVLLTVALAVVLLDHTPAAAVSLNVIIAPPAHTAESPVITPGCGSGFTVTVAVVESVPQPFVTLYVIIVLPPATPVTIPVGFTVAIDVALLLQLLPASVSLRVVTDASQTVVVPVIGPATGGLLLTKNKVLAYAVPQLLVTAYEIVSVP